MTGFDSLWPKHSATIPFPTAKPAESTLDLPAALQAARKALAENPHSVFANVLVADLYEAQGDIPQALAACEAALSQFYRQYPDGPAPPLRLLQKRARLKARLQLKR